MIEFITCHWQRCRVVLIITLLVAIAIFLGYLAATNIFLSVLCLLLVIGSIALFYIFFKDGLLSLDRVILPLLIVAVLLPPIRFPTAIPAVRMELAITISAWVLLILGHLAGGKHLRIRWNPTNKWFFIFGACILVSMVYAVFAHGYYPIARDFWEFGKLIEYFLIFALVASLNIPQDHMRNYYIISLIIFMCSAAFGFFQYFNLFAINSWLTPYYAPTQMYGLVTAGRIVGTTPNPNEFGALMVLAASLALTGALWLKGRNIKLFSWAALVVFSLAVMFTLSRSALLGLLVAIAFIILYKYLLYVGSKRMLRSLMLIIPLIMILAIIVLELAPDLFFFRVGRSMDLDTDTSWQARLINWEDDFALWQQSPLLGWGPGKDTMSTIVDNEWLLLLRRYGLFGVAIFILLFVNFYRTLSDIERENNNNYTQTFCTALQATIIAYAIYMIPAAVYHSLQLMPVLMIFLGLVYSQRQHTLLCRKK